MNVSRIAKVLGWIVLALTALAVQGYAVFWFGGYPGAYLSRIGLECTAVPVFIELVLFVVTMMHLDRLHAGAVANPHSLLGQALRQGDVPPPPLPYGDDKISESQTAVTDMRRKPHG